MKSALFTCSKMRDGVLLCGSRTTSKSLMMFVWPHRFCKILISRLIFFFLTGFKILTTHLQSFATLTPSKTSLYLPLPIFLTTS